MKITGSHTKKYINLYLDQSLSTKIPGYESTVVSFRCKLALNSKESNNAAGGIGISVSFLTWH